MTMTTRALLNLSLSSTLISSTSSLIILRQLHRPLHFRPLQGFRHLRSSSSSSAAATTTTTIEAADQYVQPTKHAILLERLRLRHLKETSAKCPETKPRGSKPPSEEEDKKNNKRKNITVGSFEEFGLSEEVMGAVREMGIQVPTEIQSIGIPAVLDGQSVVLASHTGSGKTLAYLLPLVQLMRRDEAIFGRLSKPRRPRAVVLCPTRELSEQVFHVAKSISHHARFRSTMVSGGGRLRPQEDSLNNPIDMVVGTPGRVLQHIEEGNLVYGDIRYLVLDEADTMFDRGFGPDLRKFLAPLNHRASKPDGLGFQTILVSATMTKAVQSLVDEEFQGIIHLRTSTLHKKIASARHDFIKLSGSENKLEALLQVLEPSLAKGNKVMVFCNTLNSSRAVDHFLNENQISTVNYHGEVPAEQRVVNLQKFKSDHGDCPSLVCTDLAARGLDLDVDHVIMFDFPLNSVDYLHRTGRTARMGAKGKVTSLVSKRDLLLATRIEEALRKNESLESLNKDNVRRDVARSRITEQKDKKAKLVQVSKGKTQATSGNISNQKGKTKATSGNISNQKGKTKAASGYKASSAKSGKSSAPAKSVKVSKSLKFSADRKRKVSKSSSPVKTTSSKLSVVGFRGRSSSEKRGSSA